MVSVAAAEVEAEKISTTENPLGGLGPRFNRRSPFLIGMGGAAGVALTYVMVLALSDARSALTLIGVALFLAIGLEPVVNWLVHHRFRRWAAVTTVSLGALALVAGLLAIAIPPLSSRPRSWSPRPRTTCARSRTIPRRWVGSTNGSSCSSI